MQAGGALDWNDAGGAFTPSTGRQGQISAGAAAGREGLSEVLADGGRAGAEAAAALGLSGGAASETPRVTTAFDAPHQALARFATAPGVNLKTAFIDTQNDVTAADVDLAWREGYRSVEHLKRYTTLGMATDQGKSSNILGLARLAAAEGRPAPEVGLTTFRPPFTPVTLAALAGEATGRTWRYCAARPSSRFTPRTIRPGSRWAIGRDQGPIRALERASRRQACARLSACARVSG